MIPFLSQNRYEPIQTVDSKLSIDDDLDYYREYYSGSRVRSCARVNSRLRSLLLFVLVFVGLIFIWRHRQPTTVQLFGNKTDCPWSLVKQSSEVPTDVNKVRPADVRIIGALGDSITVGYLSKNKESDSNSIYMGNSLFAGGDDMEKHVTLANIISHFNPNLVGKSYGTEHRGFNAAVAGKTSEDLERQVDDLIYSMKKESKVNVSEDWKLITLFIGTNDVGTLGCIRQNKPISYENYKSNIEKALQKLKEKLPRTIVAILAMWDSQFAIEAQNIISTGKRLTCTDDNEKELKHRDELVASYRRAVYEIQDDPKFHSSNFTVTVQGFFYNVTEPFRGRFGSFDPSFYAGDLFHLSKYGNSVLAKAFWNELVGGKTTLADSPLLCPDENSPYIRTVGNS